VSVYVSDSAELDVQNPPDNFTPAQLLTNVVVPGNIVVYGFTVYNTKASAQFLCMFDGSTLPGDGAVPALSWPLAAHNGVGFQFGSNGRRFKNGVCLCNSSTDASKTIGSADCLFDVQYVRLTDLYVPAAEGQ
jgi:hypothetical protein